MDFPLFTDGFTKIKRFLFIVEKTFASSAHFLSMNEYWKFMRPNMKRGTSQIAESCLYRRTLQLA